MLPEGSYLTHRLHGKDPFTLGLEKTHFKWHFENVGVFCDFFAAKSVGIPGVFEESPL